MNTKVHSGVVPVHSLDLGTAVRVVAGWLRRITERRALLQLDDRMLRDIGVTRGDALDEAAKPFWAD